MFASSPRRRARVPTVPRRPGGAARDHRHRAGFQGLPGPGPCAGRGGASGRPRPLAIHLTGAQLCRRANVPSCASGAQCPVESVTDARNWARPRRPPGSARHFAKCGPASGASKWIARHAIGQRQELQLLSPLDSRHICLVHKIHNYGTRGCRGCVPRASRPPYSSGFVALRVASCSAPGKVFLLCGTHRLTAAREAG
jgi:hypothetical protein